MRGDVGTIPTTAGNELPNGWWKEYAETISGGYLDLLAAEESASRIVHFHPTVVPGLLQTEGYAAALTPKTTLKSVTEPDVALLVRVRMRRQRAAFEGTHPKELVFILDESTLYRPMGPPQVMRDQLVHVLEMVNHPRVMLTVVPFSGEPHPGLLGPFMLMQYGSGLPDALCFEWQMGNVVVHDQPQLVTRYRKLADRLRAVDPDGVASVGLIRRALDRLS